MTHSSNSASSHGTCSARKVEIAKYLVCTCPRRRIAEEAKADASSLSDGQLERPHSDLRRPWAAVASPPTGASSLRQLDWYLDPIAMCRNIKTLFNFDPPVTEEEIQAASLQFVRKISGFTKPSKANERVFLEAVDEVAGISSRLLLSLETNAPPKNREEEAAKAKARAAERFGG